MSEPSDTVERHRRFLARVAELSLSLAERLHERAMEAESVEEAQGLALAFQRVTRSLRQTLALEARLEREERRGLVEDRRLAAEDHRQQLGARKRYVGDVGSRLIWTEAEGDEVGALLVDLKRWLDEEAFFEDEFLATPVEALIERLREDLGLIEAELDEEEEEVEADPPDPSPLAGSEASRTVPSGCPSRQRFGEMVRPDGGLPEEGRMRGLSDPSAAAQPFSPQSG